MSTQSFHDQKCPERSSFHTIGESPMSQEYCFGETESQTLSLTVSITRFLSNLVSKT